MSLEEKIKEAIEEGSLEDTLEKIVDKKVEEKLSEKKTEDSAANGKKEAGSENEGISRRGFLKKLGMGAAGLGAASLIPSASALDIKDSNGLNVYSGGDQYLDVKTDGNVEIPSGGLSINGSTSGQTLLELTTSDNESIKFKGTGANASGANEEVALFGPDGSELMRWADATSKTIIKSELDMKKNNITRADNIVSASLVSRLETKGGGSNTWKFYDSNNSQDIANFHEGGNVEIPNGQLSINGAGGSLSDLKVGSSGVSFSDDNVRIGRGLVGNSDTLDLVGNTQVNLGALNTSTVALKGYDSGNVEIPNGKLGMANNNIEKIGSLKTDNFTITENSSTNSLDFNYTG